MMIFLLFIGATARMMMVPAVILSGATCGWFWRRPWSLFAGGFSAMIMALLIHSDIRLIFTTVLADGVAQASFLFSVFTAGCVWAFFASVVRPKFYGRRTSVDVPLKDEVL
ncbi:hypothetical protein BDE40_1672 [Litoreibacter halocynthiae]|uniref:Uncharacterized protein n=1 Tax=Litoreibacter halocynthiae TaxID=1242689 RepID=A0A4R7LKM3_9RHOB|nr:hypothetical protein [Litoreibacter halocynthiae]TDT74951.1 hypothetical protein BDE40_1672 [Litoreibacter halocynthiae]